MEVIVSNSTLSGTVRAASSKSSMQRACAAALLSKGVSTLLNPGHSNDDTASLDVAVRLGAEILTHDANQLVINSNGVNPVSDEINCGESGLGVRMLTPLAALSARPLIINGTGSLLTRPMDFFDNILPQLGVAVQSNDGRLPLNIQGPLTPANITIDGSLSSQFLTGLLMAFAAAGARDVEITVTNLKSRPYIDLTLQVIAAFGVRVENRNYRSFYFPPTENHFVASTYRVEGDWSGGAFLLVAAAIAGDLNISGLDPNSTQADKAILSALSDSGCKWHASDAEIFVSQSDLSAFEFDATDCPDLFPPLVALAGYCKGTTVIKGVSRLKHKESNRGITLQTEFAKMGVTIELDDDVMRVEGGPVKGARVHSHHDHRIAMACAVAALRASGETIIEEAQAINKSYPDFYSHLRSVGGRISISEHSLSN
jgi:3-phosphoshikimate 1-carboxyvinyltransferase